MTAATIPYTPPLKEIRFVLDHLAGMAEVAALPGFEDASPDMVDSILDEAAKIAGNVLAPLNRIGDIQGARLGADGVARTAEGWGATWQALVEGGWNGLPFDPARGGMGLPNLLNTAVQEMWHSANMAFALCPMLTQGAVNAVQLYGSEALKDLYLPKMISGEWTGTMNITEPQAGSDLAATRSRAVPDGDHHLVTGQKIFITYGDHDLTENIVHLVLARLPDAPPGVKGISLFVVPKVLVNPDGSLGARNQVKCVSLEHKLGIHGSPTAVLSFGDEGGATGFLVGEPNRGLEYMFTMMNHARLAVAMQGLSIAERAYQQALAYARDRVQGKPAGWSEGLSKGIVNHPDVRRLLMGMKAKTEAMRGLLYSAAAAVDIAHRHPDGETRARAALLVDLLTPIAKGWCTETGQALASDGVQVHGGMGFVEETGAAQHLRDARITTIYEGTTAIQANDLVNRKILRDGGGTATTLLDEIAALGRELAGHGDEPLRVTGAALADAAEQAKAAVAWLVVAAREDVRLPAAASVPLLELMGLVAGGWQLARAARLAAERLAAGDADAAFLSAKPLTARFFATHVLPRAAALRETVVSGSASVMALSEEQLFGGA
ncbi:acyl-CoA dehydrogenase C-terminal domain-containing protein [Azospirillum picis]|uniref:Alkylation response protein AidB-like acyl-CoA dehydrogenase n=1 Tax=Azospirillum picis TaxID=488438 RepID=A0ABU0MQ20_9PROT|nr:acyl-CoA dehydrogenase C-terminal domain-containing protein [Azospirillum picis]MBP2301600.1 alkylation response protein AidB-like acyl-CoA dehydrogenase [Azospirillum picis]MDQ0535577.1 alkylation response protein AidB-like acyl-CoA dehydrogenase [Azospirillum picis]